MHNSLEGAGEGATDVGGRLLATGHGAANRHGRLAHGERQPAAPSAGRRPTLLGCGAGAVASDARRRQRHRTVRSPASKPWPRRCETHR